MRILIQYDRDAPMTEYKITDEEVPLKNICGEITHYRYSGRKQVTIGEFSHASKLTRELFRAAIWFTDSRAGGKCCLIGDDGKIHFAHPDRYAEELGIPRLI